MSLLCAVILHKSRQLTSLSLIDDFSCNVFNTIFLDTIFLHLVNVAIKRSDAKLVSITASSLACQFWLLGFCLANSTEVSVFDFKICGYFVFVSFLSRHLLKKP